ncbi:precorrin-2 C(20)-methyltransferase [Oceanicella actignis]|uniref:Precorrin-2/cobalt-factor-2 C20-methyltransferase n=1 Tax=Oceanicella actignis TaxID=1189325 RepID=A0A1M7THS3_9RHOB|nr:precorrin-2 C(20)-methyltransferase [Oceanicella actignis]SET58457.1 precorrin-2/cobalt-factor-2 C20-methyltransferase [Oceanicella actignis]SHN70302.1 precorrin-2/cobalt-factor-2 C20-methyltransferase [Oceanicella actignis]
MSATGTLHGVGVGPGDPELLTLRAARLIGAADVVAYLAPAGGDSFARAIARAHIRPDAEELRIEVPMAVERHPAQGVYDAAAARIARRLDAGRDVVMLCEGDPFFYGSFMYVHARLAPHHRVQVTPGVSSLGACAAALGRPLTARNDVLTVIPGPLPDDEMRRRIEGAEAVAIMKVGRHFARIRALLGSMGLADRAGYVERASLPVQRAVPLAQAPEQAPYFSMILIYKGNDPWLT